jgi:multidrug resistance protein MdtO
MTAVESPLPRGSLLASLLLEFRPRDGRGTAVLRIVIGVGITILIAMIYQIPQPAYSAYIVFLISKDEQAATVTAAVGGLIAGTLATALALGLSIFDSGEPAIRLPLMAVATFVAMFAARTSPLGPISYLAGFMLVLLQSLTDDIANPERLTRLTLWIWVIVALPVAVTCMVNTLLGQSAAALVSRTVHRILRQLQTALASGDFHGALPGWRAQLTPLLTLHAPGRINAHAIAALSDALMLFESVPSFLPDRTRAALAERVNACLDATNAFPTDGRIESLPPLHSPTPAVLAVTDALTAFLEALSGSRTIATAVSAPAQRRLFAADAFDNPVYWQFALKSTLAVMSSYIIYTLLDWHGLRTAIVTCFLVALSSLGETLHKLLLRLTGAVLGGLLGALCIVFILPHLTDIAQLLVLICAVSGGAAWIATSSEMISYAGMQLAFAFFLGVLQGYAPATDLTVLRDRLVGILLGNVVITIVFSSIWPESARLSLRAAIAGMLRAIAAVLRQGANVDSAAARMRLAQELVRAEHYRSLSMLESSVVPGRSAGSDPLLNLHPLRRLAGATLTISSESLSAFKHQPPALGIGRWADSAAEALTEHRPLPPAPEIPSVGREHSSPQAILARRALDQLASEVARVAALR